MTEISFEVIELLHRMPLPPGESLPSPVTVEAIAEFESNTKLRLPDGLRRWLLVTNGPCVGPGGVMGIGVRRQSFDIEKLLGLHPAWREKGWLPVAGDGCGNYFLVVSNNDFGVGEPVIFVEALQGETAPAFISASDTWYFLRFLFKKELSQSKWPFNEAEVMRDDPAIAAFRGISMPWGC